MVRFNFYHLNFLSNITLTVNYFSHDFLNYLHWLKYIRERKKIALLIARVKQNLIVIKYKCELTAFIINTQLILIKGILQC